MEATFPPIPETAAAIKNLRAALAQPEPFNFDWDRVEALETFLREHMAEIYRLKALAQPVISPEIKGNTTQPEPESLEPAGEEDMQVYTAIADEYYGLKKRSKA
jgi:hypothetical protein